MRNLSVSRHSIKIMAGLVFLISICLIHSIPSKAEAASWTGVWTTISSPENGGPATPTDLAVDQSGNIYVTNGNRVDMLPQGSTQWQTLPTAGLTANPYSIAVDKQGSVYVLDYNVVQMLPAGTDTWVSIGGRVETQVWVPGERVYLAGKWTWINGYWANGSTNNGNMFVPTDIEVDDNLNVYVTNGGNYNTDPNTYYSCEKYTNGTWTVIGNYTNDFYLPSGVAVDSAGNVYVSNEGDDSIRVLSGGTWSMLGNSGGNHPNYVGDIAVDKWGNVYSDSLDDHSIKVWNGTTWITVRSGGNSECVTVDSDGNIYVIDKTYQTILKQQAPATQLVWTKQPAGGVGGQAWTQSNQPALVLKDANGNVEADDSTSTVTVTLNATNGASLSGTKTVQLSHGIAQFTNLSVDKLGFYTLTATINLTGGTITSATSTSFEITAPTVPVVTGVSPSSCPANGGTLITLTGTGFTGATEVSFGTAIVTTPTVINDTTLTVTAPANPTGTVDVRVKTPYWTSEINANAKLTYTGGIGGTWVGSWTSLGSGELQGPMDVTVDSSGNLFVADTYNNRIARLPAGSSQWESFTGNTDIYGLATDASGNLYVARNFEYSIMKYQNGTWSVLPTSGAQWYANDVAVDSQGNVYTTSRGVKKLPVGASAWQDISGNLGTASTWGIAIDKWDNIYVASHVDGRILELPHGSATWQDITYGGGFSYPRGITVDSKGNLYVTDYINKNVKELVSGSTQWQDITLGGGFQAPSGMTVDRYDNLYLADFGSSVIRKHQAPAIKLQWQIQPAGHKNRFFSQMPVIKLVDANGFSETSESSHTVTITLNAANGAILSGTTTVTMTNGVAIFTDLKVDQLGTYTLTASTDIAGIPAIESDPFTVTDQPAPVISSISPNYGVINGGTVVTITGTNLLEASEVYFGSVAVTNHTVLSDTSVRVTVPAAAATGTVDVKITTPLGTSALNDNARFTYISFQVNSVSPASGPANGGTQVTITGTGFTGVSSVYFGTAEVTNPVVESDTTITVYTPWQTAGVNDVQVKKDGFLSEKNVNDRFNAVGALPGARVGSWTTIGNAANGGFKTPLALAVDSAGNVYASDNYYNKVKYLPAGSSAWQDTGSTNGYPYGVALDGAGNLYIAYNDYNKVFKKLTNGTWQNISYSGGQGYPCGVAVDSKGNVYTTGSGVKKLASGATQWQDISGNMGSYPTYGIAVDRWDNLYVTDTYRNIIWQLPYGSNKWLDITFGGGFYSAWGIAVDHAGNVYVADTMHSQIKVLPGGGTQWQVVPAANYGSYNGIGVDGNNNLYVTEGYGTVRKMAPPATELVWITQPGGGQAGTVWAQQPVLKLVDAQGNVVSDYSNTATLSLLDANGATLGGTTTVTFQNGIATFNDLKIDEAGTFKLAVSFSTANDCLIRPNSNSFTINSGIPAQLVWQTQPVGGRIGEPLATQPVLVLKDAAGNVITNNSTATVTLSLSASNGAELGGTKQLTLQHGVAAFTNLAVSKTGSYTLTAACSLAGISSSPSESFAITAGAGSKLVWQTQPGNGTGGLALTRQPVLCLMDNNNNILDNDNTSKVTLALVNPEGALLSGAEVTLQNGVAAFTECKIDKIGSYSLIPSIDLTDIAVSNSQTIEITVGPAAQLIWQTQPGGGLRGSVWVQQPTLGLADAGGNIISGDSSSEVSVSLTAANGATLGGSKSLPLLNGIAAFTDLQVDKAGNYTLTATSSLTGVPGAVSGVFTIDSGMVAKLVFQTQPGNGTGGSELVQQPEVWLTDMNGNIIDDSTTTVTLTLTDAKGAQLGGTRIITLENGTYFFWDLMVNKAGSYTLIATSSETNIETAESDVFTITVGPAAQLIWQTQPGNATAGEVLTQQPALLLADLGGNIISDDSSSAVTAALNNANGAVLGGTTQVTIQQGQAVFTNLQVNKAGTYTLTMVSNYLTSPASQSFTIDLPPEPITSTISPASGPFYGGTLVTITGTGFAGVTDVYFGTVAAKPTVISDTELTVIAPKQIAGSADVRVKTPYWTSAVNANVRFTYTAAPSQAWAGSWITLDTTSLGSVTPKYVTADSGGNIYVTDYYGDRVLKRSAGSTTWDSWGCTSPVGIAAGIDDSIYVTSGNKVLRRQADSWQEITSAEWTPKALAVDSQGNLYATSSNTCAVYKLPSGASQWQIISGNIANLDFAGIAVDRWDHVYVSTLNQRRIYELPANGTVWQDITNSGGFNYPYGIAADHAGNIYVCDTMLNMIKELPGGAAQWIDLTFGGKFNNPCGIALDSQGNIYVADESNGLVKKHLAPAARFAWQIQPGNGQEGASLAQQPTLKLVDAYGNVETGASNYTVTVALNNTNGAVLGGTTTVTLVNGIAKFTDLKADKAGTYTLRLESTLTGVEMPGSDQFTITSPVTPTVESISPANGIANGWTLVTINGTGFTADSQVYFGETAAPVQTVVSDTMITAYTPRHTAATVDVKVMNPGFASVTNANARFAFTAVSPGTLVGAWMTIGNIPQGFTSYVQDAEIDSAGNIYAADEYGNKIVKLPAGSSQWEIAASELQGVSGVAVDSANHIYASLYSGNQVMKYQNGGWADITFTNGPSNPRGIAVDSVGNVYSSGVHLKKLPAGTTQWQDISGNLGSTYTNGIEVDPQGNVYVTAPENGSRIYQLPNGYGVWQDITYNGAFNAPERIAADHAGNIYVADTSGHKIKLLPCGSTQWQDISAGQYFYYPKGIMIDGSDNLYVLDLNPTLRYHQAAATRLEWQTQPGGGDGYANWAQQPVLKLVDAHGNVQTGDSTDTVTVTLIAANGAVLSGTTTVTLQNGVATFTDLQVNKPGTYTLVPVLNIANHNISCPTSNSFTITKSSNQTETPIITDQPTTLYKSISGTAMPGASIVLSINGIAQPAVTADQNGAWTVTGLTLEEGANISVTAQGTGKIVSDPATAIVIHQDNCFIATAAFGSKFTWPVALLRHFRDQYLLTNSLGTAFVKFYYKHSPPIAEVIADNQLLKLLVRVLLAPFVAGIYFIYHPAWLIFFILLLTLLVNKILKNIHVLP